MKRLTPLGARDRMILAAIAAATIVALAASCGGKVGSGQSSGATRASTATACPSQASLLKATKDAMNALNQNLPLMRTLFRAALNGQKTIHLQQFGNQPLSVEGTFGLAAGVLHDTTTELDGVLHKRCGS